MRIPHSESCSNYFFFRLESDLIQYVRMIIHAHARKTVCFAMSMTHKYRTPKDDAKLKGTKSPRATHYISSFRGSYIYYWSFVSQSSNLKVLLFIFHFVCCFGIHNPIGPKCLLESVSQATFARSPISSHWPSETAHLQCMCYELRLQHGPSLAFPWTSSVRRCSNGRPTNNQGAEKWLKRTISQLRQFGMLHLIPSLIIFWLAQIRMNESGFLPALIYPPVPTMMKESSNTEQWRAKPRRSFWVTESTGTWTSLHDIQKERIQVRSWSCDCIADETIDSCRCCACSFWALHCPC